MVREKILSYFRWLPALVVAITARKQVEEPIASHLKVLAEFKAALDAHAMSPSPIKRGSSPTSTTSFARFPSTPEKS
jgi:hypothetical protein